MEPQLISNNSLNADFASLLLNIGHSLSTSPDQKKNLKTCKEYCELLKVSGSSNDSQFTAKDIANIRKCSNFKQLLEIVKPHMSWDEHSILTQIINHCKSVEGQQEIKDFERKLALFQGLQIISSRSSQSLSEDFVGFCVIIDQPYKKITIEEYKNIKAYICGKLNICAQVAGCYTKMLYHSIHIEWLVTVQAVPHMIKSAYQTKDIFIKRNFVFMQIGSEVVINDEVCKYTRIQ